VIYFSLVKMTADEMNSIARLYCMPETIIVLVFIKYVRQVCNVIPT